MSTQPSDQHEESLGEANARADRTRTPWIVGGVIVLTLMGLCVLGGPLMMGLLNTWESARRNMCANHLRGTVLALQAYHEVHGAFPPGWTVEPRENPDLPTPGVPTPSWGWQARIVPLLDTRQTYLLPNDTQRPLGEIVREAGPDRRQVLAETLEQFVCPSDEAFAFDGANHPQRRWLLEDQPVAWGLSMIVGNTGHLHDIRGGETNSGIFYGNSAVSNTDVTDGVSYTILVGERDLTNCRGGSWLGVPNPQTHDGGPSIWNAVAGPKPGINAAPWDGDTLCGEGFSSLHPEGANVALVDGSVHFLNSNIDAAWTAEPDLENMGVLQQMMMRSDGLEDIGP